MTEYEARHGIADCVKDILFICWRRDICKSRKFAIHEEDCQAYAIANEIMKKYEVRKKDE